MIWRIAFATVLLKKPTTVATPTRKASFGAFLCISSVINTDKNGMIIKPNGGKKKDSDNDRNHTDTLSPFRTPVFL